MSSFAPLKLPFRALSSLLDKVALNPQPLPRKSLMDAVALNPQPLPPKDPLAAIALNPQPLPPKENFVPVALKPNPLPPRAVLDDLIFAPAFESRASKVAFDPQPEPPVATKSVVPNFLSALFARFLGH